MTNILNDLPCHWAGSDDTTPDGCTLYATTYLGVPTTYILRDGRIIGRVEQYGVTRERGWFGNGLKGGVYLGSGSFGALAQKIAELDAKENH